MQRSEWLERNAMLLPAFLLIAVWGAMMAPRSSVYSVMLGCVFALPATALILGTVMVYRSRDQPAWIVHNWLPLRGRWLCYFVSALVALPATMVTLGTILYLLGD
jgi:hypothetical protein